MNSKTGTALIHVNDKSRTLFSTWFAHTGVTQPCFIVRNDKKEVMPLEPITNTGNTAAPGHGTPIDCRPQPPPACVAVTGLVPSDTVTFYQENSEFTPLTLAVIGDLAEIKARVLEHFNVDIRSSVVAVTANVGANDVEYGFSGALTAAGMGALTRFALKVSRRASCIADYRRGRKQKEVGSNLGGNRENQLTVAEHAILRRVAHQTLALDSFGHPLYMRMQSDRRVNSCVEAFILDPHTSQKKVSALRRALRAYVAGAAKRSKKKNGAAKI